MLERCEFCELNEEVLRECGGFSCKDGDITEFFTKEYADYAYQLLGTSFWASPTASWNKRNGASSALSP